jgi:hypothetical protein
MGAARGVDKGLISGAIYASRFIAGLRLGQTTIVAPVYLAEISPGSI